MKTPIIICAIGAVVLSWFNWVFVVFIIGVPISILSGFRYDLVYQIDGAHGQAGLIAWFVSLFPALLSIILFVRVFRWYKNEKTLISRNIWIAFLVLFVTLPAINCIQNFNFYDTKNSPNVLIWDEQNGAHKVMLRESFEKDASSYVYDGKKKAYRLVTHK